MDLSVQRELKDLCEENFVKICSQWEDWVKNRVNKNENKIAEMEQAYKKTTRLLTGTIFYQIRDYKIEHWWDVEPLNQVLAIQKDLIFKFALYSFEAPLSSKGVKFDTPGGPFTADFHFNEHLHNLVYFFSLVILSNKEMNEVLTQTILNMIDKDSPFREMEN